MNPSLLSHADMVHHARLRGLVLLASGRTCRLVAWADDSDPRKRGRARVQFPSGRRATVPQSAIAEVYGVYVVGARRGMLA